MKYASRTIRVNMPIDQMCNALKSCASRHGTCNITESYFHIICSKRHNGGNLNLTKVTGTIKHYSDQTVIVLNAWMGLPFWLGCAIILAGLVDLTILTILEKSNLLSLLGAVALGSIFIAVDYWEGRLHIDRIERRLRR